MSNELPAIPENSAAGSTSASAPTPPGAAKTRKVVTVRNVSKVYCRNLKRSLRYGLTRLVQELTCWPRPKQPKLREGEFFAVRNVSFDIGPGEAVALIGPNGAGKSTMLKMVNGLMKPDAGLIRLRGNVGAMIELGTGFNPVLSGRENVFINASVLGIPKAVVERKLDDIIEFSGIGEFIHAPVRTYSSGMRLRLGFAVASQLNPQLLLIDEVLAVGDVGFRMKCFNHLMKLRDSGTTIVVVSHAMANLARVCKRAIVFGGGELAFDGDFQQGVTIYEQLLKSRPTGDVASRQNSAVEGRAQIKRADTFDASGRMRTEWETGEPIRVQVQIEANEPIAEARLVVGLHSAASGQLAVISSAYQDFRFSLEPGTNSVVLTLENLPLLLGSYHFDISLYGPTILDFYDRATGTGEFRIVRPSVDANGFGIFGLLKLDHSWEQLSEPLTANEASDEGQFSTEDE